MCLDVIQVFVESEKKKEVEEWMATEGRGDLYGLMESLQRHMYDSGDCTLYLGSV